MTNLTKFPDLRIVTRNASSAFDADAVGGKQIGQELGARFLLNGSVRSEQERWKITAQLVDIQSEQHLWANRYDIPYQGSSIRRDAVAQEIASTVDSWVSLADNRRIARRPSADLSPNELVLRARGVLFRAASRSSTMEARALAQRAISIDPNFAAAHVELGRTYYRAFTLQWEGPEALDRALAAAQHAILLDQSLVSAHELIGRIYLRRHQHEAAMATLQKAIGLNPARAESYASLGDALTFAGRPHEAIPILQKAIQLDPLYPPRFDMYLGRALYFDRKLDQAVLSLEACAARAPEFRACYMYLVPTYAELGRMSDARKAADRLKELAPDFSIAGSVRSHLPYVDSAMVQYIAGLKKAGSFDN
jgi:adenylate cyclase